MTKTILQLAFEKGFIKFVAPQNATVRQSLSDTLKTCIDKHNGYVLLTLDTPKKPRTTGLNSQNHHLNGHIQDIARYTGESFESVKRAVKMSAIGMGYPFKTINYFDVSKDEYGNTTKKVKSFIEPKSESECTTAECAILIEAVHIFAADWDVPLTE